MRYYLGIQSEDVYHTVIIIEERLQNKDRGTTGMMLQVQSLANASRDVKIQFRTVLVNTVCTSLGGGKRSRSLTVSTLQLGFVGIQLLIVFSQEKKR